MNNSREYSVIKFHSPFEKLKEYDFSPETKLYKSIIIQAIIDVSNRADEPSLKQDELAAKSWLFGDSADFLNICKLADLEPSNVVKMARTAISLNKSVQFYLGVNGKPSKEYLNNKLMASKKHSA